jgi:hypothetical protein
MKEGSGNRRLSLWELCQWNLEGGPFTGPQKDIQRTAQETDIPFHTGQSGNLDRRFVSRGLQVRIKEGSGKVASLCGRFLTEIWRAATLMETEGYGKEGSSVHMGPIREHGGGLVYRGL